MIEVGAAAAAGLGVLLVGAGRRGADQRAVRLVLMAVLTGVALVLTSGPLPLPLLALLAAVAAAGIRAVRSRRADQAARCRSAAVMALCEGIAADLRAGLPPLSALDSAAREWSEFRPVLDTARLGGDVPKALIRLSEKPGAGALRTVAAAWVVAHRSGAGLANAVSLAATTIREDRATARVVETELAASRATAKLLAGLPLGVLLLGRGTGGDPFGFLFGTTPGLVCLAVGLGLNWSGLCWLERIARGVRA